MNNVGIAIRIGVREEYAVCLQIAVCVGIAVFGRCFSKALLFVGCMVWRHCGLLAWHCVGIMEYVRC